VPDPAGSPRADLGWRRLASDEIPLFLFEIESRPGSQLAENAQKVLSMPTALMPKPLFFFQLVLRGGGGRAARAERSHATANYAIYSLSVAGEADRFVADVVRHHGRVSSVLEPLRLWWALADPRALSVSWQAAFDRPRLRRRASSSRGPERLRSPLQPHAPRLRRGGEFIEGG
jgi:hypothetical protein